MDLLVVFLVDLVLAGIALEHLGVFLFVDKPGLQIAFELLRAPLERASAEKAGDAA